MNELIKELLEYKKAEDEAVSAEMQKLRDKVIESTRGKQFSTSQINKMLAVVSREYIDKLDRLDNFESVLIHFAVTKKASAE